MKKTVYSILLPVICLLFNSCTSSRQVLNVDLLGSGTCHPPCWREITPGITRKDQAVEILSELASQGLGEVNDYPEYGYIAFRSIGMVNYTIYIENDLVATITFDIKGVVVKDIVDLFGDPEYIVIRPTSISGECLLSLYYPRNGIFFDAECTRNIFQTKFNISPDASINRAFLSEESDLSTILSRYEGTNWEYILEHYAKFWPGFGSIDISEFEP